MPPDSRLDAQTEPAAQLPTRVIQPDPVSTILVSAPAAARDAAGPSEITVEDPVRALVALGENDLTGPDPARAAQPRQSDVAGVGRFQLERQLLGGTSARMEEDIATAGSPALLRVIGMEWNH